MTILRARLRLLAALWLVCQAATLAAFVPRDCCADHRPVEVETSTEQTDAPEHCHEPPPAETHCPMRAPDGAPCPMHAGSGDGQPAGAPDCSIGGACGGPMTGLVRLLSNHGILPDAPALPDVTARFAPVPGAEDAAGRPASPDAPPPRP